MSTQIVNKKILHGQLLSRFPLNRSTESAVRTFHVTMRLEEDAPFFEPGSSIALHPRNSSQEVHLILRQLGKTGDEEVVEKKSLTSCTLFEFLSTKANLTRSTPSLIDALLTHDATLKNHPLLLPFFQDDLPQKKRAFLEAFDPSELFTLIKKPSLPHSSFPDPLLQSLCDGFAPLLPRFYSIASSCLFHPQELHLTVGMISYEKNGRLRKGVASQFLCEEAVLHDTLIPFSIQEASHFTLPSSPLTPIIMIGPGTGVAPFRAFVQHRALADTPTQNWLFFGERHAQSDFYYEEFWNAQIKKGILRVDTAFSRDQEEKVYVQHRLLEKSQELYRWIEAGAHIYICGNASRMAKDVEQTLSAILQKEACLSLEKSLLYLKEMKKERRLQLDVY